MSVHFRVLDFTGLDIPVEVPEKTTVAQLSNILKDKYSVDTEQCSFSSSGNLLDDETEVSQNLFLKNDSITILNNSTYPVKSFPRVEECFPKQRCKYSDFFQEQPEFQGLSKKKKRNDKLKTVQESIFTRLIDVLNSNPSTDMNLQQLVADLSNQGIEIPLGFLPNDDEELNGSDDDENQDDNEDEIDDNDNEEEQEYDNYDGDEGGEFHDILMPNGFSIRIVDSRTAFERSAFGFEQPGGMGFRPLLNDEVENDEAIPPEIAGFEMNFTNSQKESIDRICEQTGVARSTVMQVFEACDRNEDITTNCLMSMS